MISKQIWFTLKEDSRTLKQKQLSNLKWKIWRKLLIWKFVVFLHNFSKKFWWILLLSRLKCWNIWWKKLLNWRRSWKELKKSNWKRKPFLLLNLITWKWDMLTTCSVIMSSATVKYIHLSIPFYIRIGGMITTPLSLIILLEWSTTSTGTIIHTFIHFLAIPIIIGIILLMLFIVGSLQLFHTITIAVSITLFHMLNFFLCLGWSSKKWRMQGWWEE